MKTIIIIALSLLLIGCSTTKEVTTTHTETTETTVKPPTVVIDSLPMQLEPAQAVIIHDTVWMPALIPDMPEVPVITNYIRYKYPASYKNDTIAITADAWVEVLQGTKPRVLWLSNVKIDYKPVPVVVKTIVTDTKKDTVTKPWYQFLIEFKWIALIVLGIVILGTVVYFKMRT